MNKRVILILGFIFSVVCLTSSMVMGQSGNEFPEIGDICPEFSLKSISDSSKKITSSGLRGKYLLLDFWTVACVPCVEKFPVLNDIQNQFRDKLLILNIGTESFGRDVASFYRKFESKYSLNLFTAIDSNVFKKFVHGSVPFVIWVNQNGVIKAITDAESVSRENIEKFIEDSNFLFTDRSYSFEQSNKEIPKALTVEQIVKNPAKTLTEFRIEKWIPGTYRSYTPQIMGGVVMNEFFAAMKQDLTSLYHLAYFGSNDYVSYDFYPLPILAVRDSSIFNINNGKSAPQKFNYIYFNPIAKLTGLEIMNTMRRNLDNAFPYKVEVVEADMPCLKVVVVDSLKLRKAIHASKSHKKELNWIIELKRNKLSQIKVKDLASIFGTYMGFPLKNRSFDFTFNDDPVDILFKGDIDSLENIRLQISAIGLDYVPSLFRTKVLRVTDR